MNTKVIIIVYLILNLLGIGAIVYGLTHPRDFDSNKTKGLGAILTIAAGFLLTCLLDFKGIIHVSTSNVNVYVSGTAGTGGMNISALLWSLVFAAPAITIAIIIGSGKKK